MDIDSIWECRRKFTHENIYHMEIWEDFNREIQIYEQDVYFMNLFVQASQTLKHSSH
jgi:hypothetical protein